MKMDHFEYLYLNNLMYFNVCHKLFGVPAKLDPNDSQPAKH